MNLSDYFPALINYRTENDGSCTCVRVCVCVWGGGGGGAEKNWGGLCA